MEAPAASPVPTPSPTPAGLPVLSPRVLVLVAGTAGLAALFWLGRDVLAPFVVGILIVYLLDPLVERLARISIAGRRVPRALLIVLVYVGATLVLIELLLLVIGPIKIGRAHV